jgi:hypothetical protein
VSSYPKQSSASDSSAWRPAPLLLFRLVRPSKTHGSSLTARYWLGRFVSETGRERRNLIGDIFVSEGRDTSGKGETKAGLAAGDSVR